MLDGFYSLRFTTPLGTGIGVIVLDGERIRGGGEGLYCYGTLQALGAVLAGRVRFGTHHADAEFRSVLGANEGILDLSGELLANGSIAGTAAVLEGPGLTFSFHLSRIAEGKDPVLVNWA